MHDETPSDHKKIFPFRISNPKMMVIKPITLTRLFAIYYDFYGFKKDNFQIKYVIFSLFLLKT